MSILLGLMWRHRPIDGISGAKPLLCASDIGALRRDGRGQIVVMIRCHKPRCAPRGR